MAVSASRKKQAGLEFAEALEAEFQLAERGKYERYRGDPVGFIEQELGFFLTDQQKLICESVRDNRETNIQASHGVGKCVAKNAKMLLASGLEVAAKSLVGKQFELLTLINGQVKAVPALATWNLMESVYEVTTETGKRIIRNAEHPLFAAIKWTRDGAHPIVDVQEWSSVLDMQKWMRDPPIYNTKFVKDSWSVTDGRKHEVVCAMPIEIPVFGNRSMPIHEIKILAYLIGDGGLTSIAPVFTQSEGSQLNEFRDCVAEMGCVLIRRDDYTYAITNPMGQRHTRNSNKFGYKSVSIGENRDFSCDVNISTRKILEITGDPEPTLYLRLKKLGIKPVGFFGHAYLSQSEFDLYQEYVKYLEASRPYEENGVSKKSSKVALELLQLYRDSVQIESVNLELLEARKQAAKLAIKEKNGVQHGVARNGSIPNLVTEFLRQIGIMGKGSADKVIPDCVFELPKEQLAIFLSRLFSTDGWACVSENKARPGSLQSEIGFCSISRELVEQVQRLLLRFGVTAPIYPKAKVNAWTISIRDSNAQLKFASEIGIYGKEAALQKVVKNALLKQKQKQVPKWRLKKAPEGTKWEKVVSIRKLDEPDLTVAIEVPKHHTFLTSFYEHNTAVSSCLLLWWVLVTGGLCITTAPTARQVENLLWGEVRRVHSRRDLPGEIGRKFLRISAEAHAYGFTANDNNSNAFQGVHHPNLLVIEDEACGISSEIDDGASSCVTGAENRFLRVGNPIEGGGAFEKACKRSHIRIPVWDHPNVKWAYERASDTYQLKASVMVAVLNERGEVLPQSQWAAWCPRDLIPGAVSISWIEDARAKYGEGSAYWQSRVEGFFPEDAGASIVPRSYFLAARARYDADPEYWDKLASKHDSRHGFDVGDGQDDHAWAHWRGSVLYGVECYPTKGDREDISRGTGIARGKLEAYPGAINVDRLGVGAGLLSNLIEQGYTAHGIAWSESASDSAQFSNSKAEQYWELREAFRSGEIAIAPLGEFEEMTMEDLAGTYYEQESTGKIRIEDKQRKTRKRLHRSPNAGDAVVLGFKQIQVPVWSVGVATWG